MLKIFGALAILFAYLSAFTDRMNFRTIDRDTMRWAVIAVYVIGDAVRLWLVYMLNDRFCGLVAIHPECTLETRGNYRVIWNPSYLGMLINAIGWAFVFRSGTGR